MSVFLFTSIGFQALASQILLLREIMVVVAGHEMALGLMMAFWLLGVFFGALMGARAQAPKRGKFYPLAFVLLLQLPFVLSIVLGIRNARWIFPVAPGAPLSALWATVLIALSLFPVGATSGAMFPMATTLSWSSHQRKSQAIAKVYFWEAVGSLGAGFLVPIFLIPRFDNLVVLAQCGTISGLLVAVGSIPWGKRWAVSSLVMAGAWSWFFWAQKIHELNIWSVKQRWLSRKVAMERVAGADSPYQSLELGYWEGQYTLLGNGRPIAVFPDPAGAMPLVGILMSQKKRPKSLLFLGGGPSSALSVLLEAGVERVTIVELDRAVYSVSDRFLPQDIRAALEDPRIRLLAGDGRFLLRSFPSGSFDAALVEMPDPSTALLNRFHSLEFFLALRRVLRSPGLVIHGVTGSSEYMGPELEEFLGTVYVTMKKAFGEVRVIPGERTLFVASVEPGEVTLDPEALSSASRGTWGEEGLPSGLFATWIQPFQAQIWQQALDQGSYPVNTDEHPRATLAYLSLWERLSGTAFGASFLYRMERIPWVIVYAGFCILATAAFLLSRGSGLTRGVLLTIAVTGATAMAQEMVCLYLYQIVWGHLYSRVGLLMGMFMAGLSLGAWLGSLRVFWKLGTSTKVLMGVQGGLALLCLSIPTFWVPSSLGAFSGEGTSWWQGEAAFCLWMLMAGALTGGTFPLGCRLIEGDLADTGRIAGMASAWDHFGASTGALIAGVILVPAMGLKAAGALVAGVQIFAILCLLTVVLAFGVKEG